MYIQGQTPPYSSALDVYPRSISSLFLNIRCISTLDIHLMLRNKEEIELGYTSNAEE
jgi:hypothetical protein